MYWKKYQVVSVYFSYTNLYRPVLVGIGVLAGTIKRKIEIEKIY